MDNYESKQTLGTMAEASVKTTSANDDVNLAINIKELGKSYGTKCRRERPVLDRFNMQVPTGAIYGLLGPSGCGKTTLLRMLVGLLKQDVGALEVLGRPPGSPGHGVPGKRVGYMPQVTGLHRLLSIEETLIYFGRLHGMTNKKIHQRIRFLMEFFQLPPKDQSFGTLSGGQQRRTSFAVAMIHEPELLILDEPTVGVDPMLRKKIWNYMMNLSRNFHTTVVITTLYVNEVAQADVVGMMRSGRLLAEAPPSALMTRLQTNLLEDTFRLLCLKERIKKIDGTEISDSIIAVKTQEKCEKTTQSSEGRQHVEDRKNSSCDEETADALLDGNEMMKLSATGIVKQMGQHFKKNFLSILHINPGERCRQAASCLPSLWVLFAIIMKNLHVLKRHYGLLLMALVVVPPNTCLLIWTFSTSPNDLPVAVVNKDSSNTFPQQIPDLGDFYLSHIDSKIIRKETFTSMAEARRSVQLGHQWGIVEVSHNFSADTITRLTRDQSRMFDNERDNTSLHLYLDNTNPIVDMAIQRATLAAYVTFWSNATSRLQNVLPVTAKPLALPCQLEEPVYGEWEPSLPQYIAPGVINIMLLFACCGLTSMVFVEERHIGLMNRSFSANAGVLETVLAHVVTTIPLLIVQLLGIMVFIFIFFQIHTEGSFALVILLAFFQGIVGMLLGIMVSAICDRESAAINALISMMFTDIVLSGSVIPNELMSPWLRKVAHLLPNKLSGIALRHIMQRGWGLEHAEVRIAFYSTFAWIAALLLVTVIVCKVK